VNHIRCRLFDLDGTLLDSRDSVVDAVHTTAEELVFSGQRGTGDDMKGVKTTWPRSY
jgi:phosphoglycolate phosphatase-like HAD superfamily hydrolase